MSTMAEKYKGKDLMLAVKQMDCNKLLDFALKNKSKKSGLSFKMMMEELSEQEIQVMWGELSRGVEERTEALLLQGDPNRTTNKQLHQDMSQFLQAAIDLGIAYFELNRQSGPTCTGLLSIVVHLNSKMFDLPSSLEGLRNSISLLCEKMFHSKYLYQEHVCCNTLVYLLKRSLKPRAAKKEVKRLYALRFLIPKVLATDAGEVLDLLKRCATSTLYISMQEGQKIIKIALTADVDHVSEIHDAIKQRLAVCTLKQGASYGKVYYHAWVYAVKNELHELKMELEMTCIQNLILLAIQGRQKQLVANLRKLLGQFHSQKKEIYVSKMLYFLYQPILWRYIKNPDGLVRANAAQLFLDVFPLEDPDVKIVTTDQELNDQMLMIKDLLLDDFPIVRCTTAIGLCIAMSVNWELFSEDMLKTYFKIIVNDLSCDSSSSDVRCAVAKGLKVLLENPLILPTMTRLLPQVRHLFHDMADHVRIAFCQLLLRVKKISSIKYYKIVSLEHLLARLEDDPMLAKLLVSLLHNSYFPMSKGDEGPQCWLHRCVEMVKADRGASRVFFQHISHHIGVEATAQFMKRTVESIHFYVRSKVSSKKICVLSSRSVESAPEESLGLHDPDVVSGLLDGVAILWLSTITSLEKPENKHYLKMVVSKLTKCLGDLSLFYKDTPVWQSVYYLGSFMPSSSIPSLASLCFLRLKALPEDAPPEDYLTLLECLCNQECASLLQLFSEWLEEGLSSPQHLTPKPPTKKRKTKKGSQKGVKKVDTEVAKPMLALRMLNAALDRRSCQKALLITNPDKLKEMMHLADHIKRQMELSVEKEVGARESEFLRILLMLLLKVAVLLQGEEQFGAVKFVEDLTAWFQEKVLKLLSPNDNVNSTRRSLASRPQSSPSFRQLALGMCEDLCTVMADMTFLGFLNVKSLKFLKFGLSLLQLDGGGALLLPVCKMLHRHVSYGIFLCLQPQLEANILRVVPDCYAKIVQQLANEHFFQGVTPSDLKESQSLLAASLHQLHAHSEHRELVSGITLSLLRGILASPQHASQDLEKKCNSFENLSISTSGTILLSIVCTRPKMLVYFLQQLQRYLTKPEVDIQSSVACFTIVYTIREYKKGSKVVDRELLTLLEKMEGVLRAQQPLQSLDTNIPSVDTKDTCTKDAKELSFEERCLCEYKKLKDQLLQKT